MHNLYAIWFNIFYLFICKVSLVWYALVYFIPNYFIPNYIYTTPYFKLPIVARVIMAECKLLR